METQRICPSCNRPTTVDAPQGICPECLLKAGLGSGSGANQSGSSAFVPPSIETVQRFFPQLEILELIGRGGMGAVYKARQPALDRLVALKVLPSRGGRDKDFAARFTREARALARLSHPNIIAVHEFGQVEGLHYFIMEYIDGLNLRQIERSGTLSPRQALQIIPQICEALQFAHDEGIVHRDIKPENVLLDKKGRVKIADFGLAKILGLNPDDLRLTGVTEVMGTPHYMAPEQIEKPQEVDHRADIYSLGVVFYEMLTGELPLGKFAPPSRKAPVGTRWDDVVMKALEKEPDLRYQQASEVKTRVERITQEQERGVVIEDAPPVEITINTSSVRLVLAVFVGLLVVGGLIVLRKILAPGVSYSPAQVAIEASTPESSTNAVVAAASQGDVSVPAGFSEMLREALDSPADQRSERFRMIAQTVPANEMAAALAQARSILGERPERAVLEEALLRQWFAIDRAGAMAYADAEAGKEGHRARIIVAQALAEEDLDAAVAWIKKFPTEPERDSCLGGVLAGQSQKQPQKVLAKLKELAVEHPGVVRSTLFEVMTVSPQGVAEFLDAFPSGFLSQDVVLYAETASRWAQTDLNAATMWIRQLPAGPFQENVFAILLARWVQKDPLAAGEIVKTLPVGSTRDRSLQQGVYMLANTEPLKAVEFVMTLPPSGSRKDLLKGAMGLWARQDPAGAIKYADAMPVGSTRKEVYWYIGFYWGLKDPDASWNWALGLPAEEGDTRIGTAAAVIRGTATQSLPKAAAYAAQLTGSDNAYAVRALVDDAAKMNLTWTAGWVQGLPAGDGRNRAVENLVKMWAERDPVAASDWLLQQPLDSGFQNAARQMVPRALKASPELAWSWAMRLSDPKIREQQIQNVARQWMGMDPNVAKEKIQSSGLPPESVNKLLSSAK